MKKKLIFSLFFAFSLLLITKANAQLPIEYPFKSKINDEGDIFITGYKPNSGVNQISIEKIGGKSGNISWHGMYSNPNGNDKGMDMAIEPNTGDVYVTGYIYDSNKDQNHIILLKYDGSGIPQWNIVYQNYADSRALACAMDDEQNIYLCGYVVSNQGDKNFITLKYDSSGNLIWERVFEDYYIGDDIATDILIDQGFVYVIGYSYQGERYQNDLLLLVYDKEGNFDETQIFNNGGDEKPTSFIIAERSNSTSVKSKLATGGYIDLGFEGNQYRNYFTYYFNGGISSELLWTSYFGATSNNHVSTSIASNFSGDIIVSGYTFTNDNKYDFGTLKLNKADGNPVWTRFYDKKNSNNISGNDMASSVITDSRGAIYVAGYSEHASNQYVMIKYFENGGPTKQWAYEYTPDFGDILADNPIYASELHVDNTDHVIMFTMCWSEGGEARFDMVKYDHEGNISYTYDSESFYDTFISNTKTDKINLLENYPNPFNPATSIRYNLFQGGNVRIKLYNTLGRLVKNVFNGYQTEGYKEHRVDASELSSGIYYYTVEGTGFKEVRKIMLLK